MPGFIELRRPIGSPMHDTVFMYILKKGQFTFKRYYIYENLTYSM